MINAVRLAAAVILTWMALAVPALASDGEPDPGFSNGGRYIIDLGGDDSVRDVAVAGDGTISVVGSTDGAPFIISLTEEGVPNLDFGDQGLAYPMVDPVESIAPVSIADRSDGSVFVAGTVVEDSGMGEVTSVWVAGLLPNGDPITTFGADGHVIDTVGEDDHVDEILIADDGSVLVIGTTRVAGAKDSTPAGFVVRYLPSGERDSSFGTDGVATFESIVTGLSVAATLDGDAIVVAGLTEPQAFFVTRLGPDGTADPGFGSVSVQHPDVAGASFAGRSPNGRIMVTSAIGDYFVGEDLEIVTARVLRGGTLDRAFAGTGVSTAAPGDVMIDGTIDDMGRLVGVESSTTRDASSLFRMRSNGLLDAEFGTGGSAPLPFQGADPAAVESTPDGMIVTVGSFDGMTAQDVFVTQHASSIPDIEFADDDESSFEADIESIARHGITLGCNPPDNTRFCPDDPVTRGQMAAFLTRALGYTDDGGGDLFTDDDGSVFQADIDKLATAGVTRGCNPPDNTRFCPDDPVTRGQMAAFLTRALGYTDDGGGDLFTDDDGSVFQADIDKLATAGVTRGCNPPDNTRFCPDDPVTRGQMAAFLTRALELS